MVHETERIITSLRDTEFTRSQSSLTKSVYAIPFANLSLAAAKPGLIFS
jgi:hypothetical protein